MKEKMHKVYTEVPQRSYDAIVKEGWLSELLLALITDPLEAEDLARNLVRDPAKQSIAIRQHGGDYAVYPAPVSPRDFADLGANAIASWKITISQGISNQQGQGIGLYPLAKYNTRLGSWCVCQVVRLVLPMVRKGDDRPKKAVEAAEAWVRGEAKKSAVEAAAQEVVQCIRASAEGVETSAAAAAMSAAYLAAWEDVSFVEKATQATATALLFPIVSQSIGRSGRRGLSYLASNIDEEKRAALDFVRSTVARACMTFPVEAMR